MNMQIGTSFKYAKFGRGSVNMTAHGEQPIPLEEIAARCPSVMAQGKHSSRSERYTFISTLDLLRGLAKEDFHPFSIMQGGSKDDEKRGFTKHLVRLRSTSSNAIKVSGSAYEVCLLGSHDGTTSEQMYGGFLRFACQNGTIFFNGEATQVKIKHTGDVLGQVVDAAYTVVNNGRIAADHVEDFRQIEVRRDEQMAFATAASALRFGDDEPAPVLAERLLHARRVDDQSNDLWTLFNRVQENTIRGGIPYTGTRGVQQVNMHTRPVRSVDGDVKLNRALWLLTEEMAKLKVAA